MVTENREYIALADIPNLPTLSSIRNRRKICAATVVRWWRRGLKAVNGKQVYLNVCKIGGLPVTKEAWLDEFFSELAATSCDRPAKSSLSELDKSRLERANNRLKQLGF